ncbi:MAG: PLP-dependent aminotransferase family protein [Bacteroidota bacterium]|nr:PLP-dependent aminotransferase family protein [Candidatus Kapabacteria bacterium]MDW8220056.1 PLP-dependent aminotransferase family protein [Bacteroidota bacterium]
MTNRAHFQPEQLFAARMSGVPTSFIREILKTTIQPNVISFAGGLPNPSLFPVEAFREAADRVLSRGGRTALQYAPTEGYLPLREYIAARYKAVQGLDISPEEILITSGSQQGIDLLGKVLINPCDAIAIEKPGYLGAIQALSVYQPRFCPVTLTDEGVDVDELEALYDHYNVKLFSAIPNFQNPTGISYTEETRKRLAEALIGRNTIVVEDDPYGDLRFFGTRAPSLRAYFGSQCVMLGSFSKIAAPGFRLGWIVAAKPIMEKLVIAKQATDLHTNFVGQCIMYEYLANNDLDVHIQRIVAVYREQCEAMTEAIQMHFPHEAIATKPEGGMFVWITMPENFSTVQFFNKAIRHNVAFVPGTPFYVGGGGENTMRLNYSCSDVSSIREGIRRLGRLLHEAMMPATEIASV